MRRCEKCGTELAHGLCFVCPIEYSTISCEPIKMDVSTESLLKMVEKFKAEQAEREAKSRAEMQRLYNMTEPEAAYVQELAAEMYSFNVDFAKIPPVNRSNTFVVIDDPIETQEMTKEQWDLLVKHTQKRVLDKRFSIISLPPNDEPFLKPNTCPTCGRKHYLPFCYICEPMPMEWGEHPDHDEAVKAASYQWSGKSPFGGDDGYAEVEAMLTKNAVEQREKEIELEKQRETGTTGEADVPIIRFRAS